MIFARSMKLCVIFFVLAISGCSVSSLRCGVSEDQSYVDLVNVPQDLAGQARHYAELCGFAYEVRYETS